MQKQLFKQCLAAIFIAWALWNYNISLQILGYGLTVLMPLLFGIAIAFIVNVLMDKLEGLWQFLFKGRGQSLKRPVCMTLSFLLLAGVAAAVFVIVMPELHASIKVLAGKLPEAAAKFNIYLHDRIAAWNLSESDIAYIQNEWKNFNRELLALWNENKSLLLSRTLNVTASLAGVITNFVLGVVFAIYILLDKERLAANCRKVAYAYCSRERAEYILNAAELSRRVFAGFVEGQLTEAFLLGLMCFAGMLVLGMPYALTISALVAFLALVPIVGTMISALAGCIFILISQPEKIWLFIIFFIILQRIEGDLLYPRIIGKSVGLSGLWVLAAVTFGGSMGGILGMVISVPVCSVLYALFAGDVKKRLEEKGLDNC